MFDMILMICNANQSMTCCPKSFQTAKKRPTTLLMKLVSAVNSIFFNTRVLLLLKESDDVK